MDWFSAKNFCDANGRDMISFSELNCPYPKSAYDNYCGYCCSMQSSDIDHSCDGDGESSGITKLRSAGIPDTGYWAGDLASDSSAAFSVNTETAQVSTWYSRGEYKRALCH